MKRLLQYIEGKSVSENIVLEKKSNVFMPFINERDSMGRLLSQPKKTNDKALSWRLKKTIPEDKKQLLTKLFEDSLSQKQNNGLNMKLQESIINLDRRTWKAKTFTPVVTQECAKINGRSSSKKMTLSDLHLYNSQRKPVESSRLSWASTEASESQQPSLTMLPKSKPELKTETTSKTKMSHSKTLPKLVCMPEKVNKKQTQTNQEEENDRLTNQFLKNETFRRKSGLKILEDNSYFRNIKTQDDECIYAENQKAFQNKIVSMKEKLNTLRSRIGEFV